MNKKDLEKILDIALDIATWQMEKEQKTLSTKQKVYSFLGISFPQEKELKEREYLIKTFKQIRKLYGTNNTI